MSISCLGCVFKRTVIENFAHDHITLTEERETFRQLAVEGFHAVHQLTRTLKRQSNAIVALREELAAARDRLRQYERRGAA